MKKVAPSMLKVLVCGGAGYIGTHAVVALLERGHEVVVYDNLSNSSRAALDRVGEIVGKPVPFVLGDVRDTQALQSVLADGMDAVMHFAGLKAVGESCTDPLSYFENNVAGTISLLRSMDSAGVTRLIFSSSATVYGVPDSLPVHEDAPIRVTNPYGRTKAISEGLIGDMCAAHPGWKATLLRYFNPVGAHASGLIGEHASGIPNNLMPYVTQVAVGNLPFLKIFGADYPTVDGTGVRDYIHVSDLADAHVSALERLAFGSAAGCDVFNIGCGRGYSVLELLRAFERASGKEIPFQIVGRRPADVGEVWASTDRARSELGWEPRLDLDRMCEDSWRWQLNNPTGYGGR